MSDLQILMPMGGLGNRFAEKGYTVPKPLIPVDGKPMFMRALDSFTNISNVKYTFVIRKSQDEQYDLANQIRTQLPDAKINILDHNTRGAVETCLIAMSDIDDNTPLVVADCDIYFKSVDYFEKIKRCQETGELDGLLLTFNADDPRYSYVKVDSQGHAVRTAEKVVISNHAILGGYFFKSGGLFKSLAEQFVSKELPGGLKEYFMSHLFNILLEQEGTIEIAAVDTMHIFGTPEELQTYFDKTSQEQ